MYKAGVSQRNGGNVNLLKSIIYRIRVWRQVRRIESVTRQRIAGCNCFWCKEA